MFDFPIALSHLPGVDKFAIADAMVKDKMTTTPVPIFHTAARSR
jgi:hypothetical protein